MARRRGHQFLGIAHGHLHGPPGLPRQFQTQGDVHGRALAAKVAAHRRSMQDEVRYGNPECGA